MDTKLADSALHDLVYKHKSNFLYFDREERHYYSQILAQCVYDKYKMNLAVKFLAKMNLYFLTKCILGYADLTPETHLPFCNHIQNNLTKCLNVIPRGYFKTTIATKALCIFLIINDPNIRILVVNATATNAEAFLKEIKSHFESNMLFRDLFREIIPSNFKDVPWANDKMQVVRKNNYSEPTVRTIGIEGNITGMHFNVIIEDDLVNEDHITSHEQMQKPIDWHKMSPALYVPQAEECKKMNIITGTRWSYFDFINFIMEEYDDSQQYIMSCYDEHGESTFPSRYPKEELARIRDAMGPKLFSCQYQNDPLPGDIAVFKKEWLKYYDELPQAEPMRVYMLVDPAISEKSTADNRAVIVIGVTEKSDWYILDYTRGIFPLINIDGSGQKNLVGELFRLYEVWKPDFVGIEEVGFQKALSILMQQEMKTRQVSFYIEPLMPRNRQTKAMRIETLAAPFSAGRVYIKNKMNELEEELLGYPAGRYKDLVDALSYLIAYEVPPSMPMRKDNNPMLVENILEELHGKQRGLYPFQEQLAL